MNEHICYLRIKKNYDSLRTNMLKNILIKVRLTQIKLDTFIVTCVNEEACISLAGKSKPDAKLLGQHGVLEFSRTALLS